MKTLELDLKKKVLIVDLPNIDVNSKPKIIQDSFGFWIYFKIKGHKPAKIEIPHTFFDYKKYKNYNFLCKGSELTEEIASEFMSDFDAFNEFTLNYEYLINLIYMIENKGFYWLENPIEKPKNRDEYYKSEKVDSFEILLKEWQEAEEKTFKNPLIFVKK